MLHTDADFPNPGSTAYLKHTAAKVRIVQNLADGWLLVSLLDHRTQGASGNRRVKTDEIFPDRFTAMHGSIRAAQRARRSRAAGRMPA